MSPTDLKEKAVIVIEAESTMTLATASQNEAWAAPVYYVYHKSGFYFFSSPTSRHVTESRSSGNAASTIFTAASSWQEIRGLQMSGTVHISRGLDALTAVSAYLKKFPFTRNFFSPTDRIDPEAFSKQFNVRLYRFRPSLIYYLDNSIRFGFREEVGL